jgi:hypothetical protein
LEKRTTEGAKQNMGRECDKFSDKRREEQGCRILNSRLAEYLTRRKHNTHTRIDE